MKAVKPIALGCVGLALGATIAGGAAFGVTTTQAADRADALAQEQIRQNAETERLSSAMEEHSHTWVPVTKTVHHNAVTENIEHPNVYVKETSYHTMCNECGMQIDGMAAEHISDTGHSGYTTNVPVAAEVLKQAAYSETVVVEDAWDETVTEGVVCTGCGTKMAASEAVD